MHNIPSDINTHFRFMLWLRRQGWAHLKKRKFKISKVKSGNGETTIFSSPCKTRVYRIKSGCRCDFDLYAQAACALKGNPYVQRVYNHFVLPDGTACTELERLYEWNAPEVPQYMKKRLIYFISLFRDPFSEPRTRALKNLFHDDPEYASALKHCFMAAIKANLQDERFASDLDLHRGNWLFRQRDKNRWDIVIADPFEYYTVRLSPSEFSEENDDDDDDFLCLLDANQLFLKRMLGIMDDLKVPMSIVKNPYQNFNGYLVQKRQF